MEILRSLEALPGFVVHGAGTNVDEGWQAGFAHYEYLPRIDDRDFEHKLAEIVRQHAIDLVYPSNDLAIAKLAGQVPGGARVVSHPAATVVVAGSKIATHNLFAQDGLVPKRFTNEPVASVYPLFSKPDVGHSSIGAIAVNNVEMLRSLVDSHDDYWSSHLLTERLLSDEVTVDCFSTRDKGLLFFAPRTRATTKNGVSVVTADYEDVDGGLEAIAVAINSRLEFNGPWFFQAKRDSRGRFLLMEIGARLAGASRIRRAQGVNLAQLAILAARELPVQVSRGRFRFVSRATSLGDELACEEPFEALYVDLDDTLILNGAPNARVVELVQHVRREGGHTAVITRHRGDPDATLRSFQLDHLFAEVRHIEDGAPKVSFIPGHRNSVLLDDSFSERIACRQKQNILAVDASCAYFLKGLFDGIS